MPFMPISKEAWLRLQAYIICMLMLVPMIFNNRADAETLQSSPRSRDAIARIKPALKKELEQKGFSWGAPIFIRIFKEDQTLEVWLKSGNRFKRFAAYPICTYGSGGLGPKTAQGDGMAPEGFYFVGPDRMNPFSRYHLAFNLGYPNAYDRHHSRTGSAIMVHGRCVSIGCFAMTDAAMEELYALADASLRNGQPFFRVHIFPFRMTSHKLDRLRNSVWHPFWQNLQEGYEWFETNGMPPDVGVKNGCYDFARCNPL